MPSVVRRLSVVGPSLLLGAAWTGWYALYGLPIGWGAGARLQAWTSMLIGPVFRLIAGGPVSDAVGLLVALGWLGLPAMTAHPIHPSVGTGVLTASGAFFWFASGILTMILCVWGA